MIKHLQPIRFEKVLSVGGSTAPWLVSCIDPLIPQPQEINCVVKLFNPGHIVQYQATAKEFLGSYFATQFDLSTPEYYLLNIHQQDFVNTLAKSEVDRLKLVDKGVCFAGEFISGTTIFNPEQHNNIVAVEDCATLFALDCLLFNLDRYGFRGKPNLLIDGVGFHLIDHEQILALMNDNQVGLLDEAKKLLRGGIWFPFYKNHLFYNRLKKYRGNKATLFDTFEEYLRNINMNTLMQFTSDLADNGIAVGQSELLIDYIASLKNSSTIFKRTLLNLIS